MSGRGDPPEGIPEGYSGGGEDDFRPAVFDESFVRAARIQEFSARERLSGVAGAVRPRRSWSYGGHWQALVLGLLIMLAFGTAVFMGVNRSPRAAGSPQVQQLRISLVPLTPAGAVPSVAADRLYAAEGGVNYRVGAEGYTLPGARATAHFSEEEVMQALSAAKDYLVASSLDPAALTGGDVRRVRELLNPDQLDQFDQSLAHPADDGLHAATGWLVRFDPARIALADQQVRVEGTMSVDERDTDTLEITTDHTLVYTVAAANGHAPASLFTVRRRLQMEFTRDDLRLEQVELVQASVAAGPLSCGAGSAAYFRPLLAGQSAPPAPAVDPYDRGRPVTALCADLRSS